MAGRLSSKVVIVTGGSTGIGRAVAGRVVAEDAPWSSPGGAGTWESEPLPNCAPVAAAPGS
jgi:hypothetical protein